MQPRSQTVSKKKINDEPGGHAGPALKKKLNYIIFRSNNSMDIGVIYSLKP
jgi:hypothetical protein